MEINEIKEIIKANDMRRFYGSWEWRSLAARARTLQHNECQRCKARGLYVPCDIVHHKKYVKEFPELALTLENLECLCKDCHELEHMNERSFLNEERW